MFPRSALTLAANFPSTYRLISLMADCNAPSHPAPCATLPDRMGPEVAGIDLHMHSTASDGALAPAELVAKCHANGVRWMALTDHDTLAGVAEARLAAEQHGMALLAGAELSTQWSGVGIHVVALLPNGEQQALAPSSSMALALDTLERAREERAERIAHKLEKKGLANAYQRAREKAQGRAAVGRPHFAEALVDAGIVSDRAEAFKRYLGAGKTGDIKALWPALEQVVEWITGSGGVAVLAHPLRYGLTRRKRGLLMDAFVAAGGEAAELVSGFQNSDRGRDLARQLDERSLYASLGSDFHMTRGPFAPGRFSEPPSTQVPPIWQHPRLCDWFRRYSEG
ncbi:3',5'-nucleoside bisphosphate phosphatase [Carnimonas sp. LMG 33810]